MSRFVVFTVFLIAPWLLCAQEKDSIAEVGSPNLDSIYHELVRYKGQEFGNDSLGMKRTMQRDSLDIVGAVDLEKVIVLGRLKFEDPLARRRYLILQRKTRKVWPYATLASTRLVELNSRLEKIEDKSDRKDYIKMIQKYLENQYKEELKNLTKTEGQILVKLLYRQTKTTAYELIREFRSGWSAFWYNAAAGLFNISLKEKYLPETEEEDFLIEDILQRSFRKGILERQKPAVEIDYLQLLEKWNS